MANVAPQPAASWTVRAMTHDDLDRVHAVETEIYPFPWTLGNLRDSLVAGYDAWVFENGPELVGYAIVMWLPDEVHLLNISVARALQGRGHGRAMLRWLFRDAASRSAGSMLLEVRPSNLHALALYRSEGFEQVGLRRGYYPSHGGAREDARVLRRSLIDG